jgi:hypothetical protein
MGLAVLKKVMSDRFEQGLQRASAVCTFNTLIFEAMKTDDRLWFLSHRYSQRTFKSYVSINNCCYTSYTYIE